MVAAFRVKLSHSGLLGSFQSLYLEMPGAKCSGERSVDCGWSQVRTLRRMKLSWRFA